MNYGLLCKVLGALILLIAVSMVVCVGLAFLERTVNVTQRVSYGLNASAAITACVGGLLLLLGRNSGQQMLRKEAIAIVGLGWLVAAFFGALPFMLAPPYLDFAGAYFESMSGFTTTGSSVIPDLTKTPHAIILWRATTQWLGGIGILVLFVAVLTYLGAGSKALIQHESSGQFGDGLYARIHDIALALVKLYTLLTLIGAVGLMLMGMSLFDALCHIFAAISTGGFSSRNESVMFYASPAIELWLSLFMLIGGVNFVLLAVLLKKRWIRWKSEEETKVYLGLLLGFSFAIAANLLMSKQVATIDVALLQGWFQVVSIMTTTGFASANFDVWPEFSRCLILILMFIGGCAGSTAGGIKVSRVVLFWKIMGQEIKTSFRPNLVTSLSLNGRSVDSNARTETLHMIALSGFAVAVGTVLVALFEPNIDLISTFSAVTANLFNIGPGLGAVGPMSNYSGLCDASQLILAALMALGRLEYFALLALFLPSLWRKY